MTATFLVALLLGLLLGVYSMLFGTEHLPRDVMLPAPHERTSEHVVDAEPSALLNWASVAAFLFAFGLAGYLITRFSGLSVGACAIFAVVTGAAAMAVQSLLIAQWAIPSARREQVDERYLLQGTIGRISRSVPEHGAGEMQYTLDGITYTLPARGVSGDEMATDVDVVLDRVENGVAYVELWTQVEQRL